MTAAVATTSALMRRALNEVWRVPGATIPGVIAPTLFLLGLTSVFGKLTDVTGFGTDEYLSFLAPVTLLQASGFTGSATGVNLARDIEQGWFDRLMVAPVARTVLLSGMVLSSALRVIAPATFMLAVGFCVGLNWPGFDGMLVAAIFVPSMAVVAALWGSMFAFYFRTQAVGPLIQSGMFIMVLFTSSYAPLDLLAPWLHDVAVINPVTQVLEAVRSGFIGDVSWSDVGEGLLAIVGLSVLFGGLALAGLRRSTR